MKLTKEQLLKKLQENSALQFKDLEQGSCDEAFFNEVKEAFEKEAIETIDASPLKKNIGQLVHKEFEVKIKELSNGHLEAIVNSGQEDRYGEVLDMKGLDIKKYMSNPILANGHDYSKYSVGKTWKLVKNRIGELIAEFTFATDVDKYDDPKILDQLYRKGYQFAFSIGFIPMEVNGNVYTKSEMIEFSPVLIGADARALLKKFQTKGLTLDLISKELGDIPIEKGGEKNVKKLTKKQLKDMLKGNPELKYDEVKEVAEEKDFNDAKAELETEAKAAKDSAIEAKVETLAKELQDAKKKIDELDDKPAKKDINIGSPKNKDINVNNGEASKELKFLYYVRGLQTKNFSEYINAVGKDAMNTGDTGVVLPPAEFVADIERLEEKVGIARQFATLKRSTTGKGVTFHKGADDVEISETAEGGAKQSTKLSYTDYLLEWRKFAAILPITDELTEDSAIDLWNDARQRFARAFVKKEDYLVFLEQSATGVKNKGVLYVEGTHEVVVDDSFASIGYNHFVDMIYGVPTLSAENGRFYMNRSAVGVAMKIKDSHGDPIWQKAMTDGTPSTILGKPYSVLDQFPGVTDADENLPVIAFGDLRYVTLGERTDLQIKVFDAGNVGDPDEVDQEANQINLLTQDAQAMRCVKRFNSVVRFPEAFSVLKLGNTLS